MLSIGNAATGKTEEVAAAAGVTIGKNMLAGTNAVILQWVAIGDNTVIDAGSVVTRSIPANVAAAGYPWRTVRTFAAAELMI
jgi:acetyltransferase-like isoleucine patch superfamily enzyme